MQARALKNYEIDTYSYAGVYLLIHDQMPGTLLGPIDQSP